MNSYPFVALEVLVLVSLSAICSGLNVALLALDMSDLVRKTKLGNKHAQKVLPLRRRTHLILAAVLLTNVAVVSTTTLVLNQRLSGWLAGTISTLLIVVFGEIIPQALFTKNPLLWSARLSPVVTAMVYVTYPLSRPMQLLLDRLFPKPTRTLQSRGELGLLISEHEENAQSELDDDEIEIIRGALSLSEKRVRDILTPITKTFWLQPDSPLNEEVIQRIKRHGYSRIPVCNRALNICYGILLMKDLVDVDFDEKAYRVDDMPLYPVQLVGSMTALDTMFRKFISSGTHMIPIERDDRIIGVVTIEDLIEEIVGHEIEDERDRYRERPAVRNASR